MAREKHKALEKSKEENWQRLRARMLFIAEHAARKQLLGEIRHARSSKMAGVPVDCVGRRSNIHVIL